MFHKILEEANAGDQMGLLARGVKHTDVRRGMCVVKPKSIKQHNNFQAQVTEYSNPASTGQFLNWMYVEPTWIYVGPSWVYDWI